MKIISRLLVAPLLVLSLGAFNACSILGDPQTPAQVVFQLGDDYQAAAPFVVIYEKLPRCSPTSTVVCSTQAAVDEIKRADNVFFVSLGQAQKIVADKTKTATAQAAASNSLKGAWTVFQEVAKQYNIKLGI